MILGIHDGHSASVSILDDDRLLRFYLEEDFCGIKRQSGFPYLAVEKILKEYPASDIDIVSFAGKYGRAPVRVFDSLYRNSAPSKDVCGMSSIVYAFYENAISRVAGLRNIEGAFSSKSLSARLKTCGLKDKRMVFCEHHLAHAYSVVAEDNKEDVLIVTLDGYGDGLSGAVFLYEGGELKKMRGFSSGNSLGLFYGQVCNSLGYREGEENSFMMLSQKQAEDETGRNPFEDVLLFSNGLIEFKKQRLKKLLKDIADHSPAKISWWIQDVLEKTVLAMIDHYLKKYKKNILYAAGGVFANTFLSERLSKMHGLSKMKRACRCDDGGLSIGAAFFAKRLSYE